MSEKELTRLEIVRRGIDKRMRQAEAASRLGLCVRHVKRLVRAVREEGAAGLVSKRRGRPSNRRILDAEKAYCIELVRERYADFGPTLAAEYLAGEHGFLYSVETLRGWMVEAGLWAPKKAGRARTHPPRERRPRLGELVQIDGSPHDWFEGRAPKCCLIAFIDDATSRLMRARFVPVESTRAYLSVLKDYVTEFGIPVAVYSDRHSIFTKHDPEDMEPTQLERALGALGIESIQANSPQAKGRVERVFQTLQDRLVKAMRLGGIDNIESANIFLETWLPKHNARFAVSPRDTEDAHQPWTEGEEALCRVCALHHERTLSKDLALSFRWQRYIVQTHDGSPRYSLRKTKVIVHEHLDGRIELLSEAESLPYRRFDEQRDRPPPACDKSLNERVNQAISRRNAQPTKPARNHPWRRYPEAPPCHA